MRTFAASQIRELHRPGLVSSFSGSIRVVRRLMLKPPSNLSDMWVGEVPLRAMG